MEGRDSFRRVQSVGNFIYLLADVLEWMIGKKRVVLSIVWLGNIAYTFHNIKTTTMGYLKKSDRFCVPKGKNRMLFLRLSCQSVSICPFVYYIYLKNAEFLQNNVFLQKSSPIRCRPWRRWCDDLVKYHHTTGARRQLSQRIDRFGRERGRLLLSSGI